MISYLQGVVVFLNSLDGVLSLLVSGVGYSVVIGQKACNSITVGEEALFFIETITKETGTSFYGFDDYEKLVWFKSLMKVTGVGPKVGMNIIDAIPIMDLTRAIIDESPSILQNIGGLGEKVANRITSELKKEPAKNAKILALTKVYNGKIAVQKQLVMEVNENGKVIKEPQESSINKNDVVSALVNLGFDYNRSFSIACVVSPNSLTLEDAIKNALQKINEF